MKIVFIDWPCFCKEGAISALIDMGHTISFFFHPEYKQRKNTAFDLAFDNFLSTNTFDCVFSFNFFPLIAEGCKRNNLKYISIVYDSPHVSLYSYTIIYPSNYVFTFDKEQFNSLSKMGISNIYYLPLASDSNRIKYLLAQPHDSKQYHSDISFVGSLYNEEHTLFDRLNGLSDYTTGYLNAIMQAQLKVYGYYFIDDVLPERIINDMKKSLLYEPGFTGVQTDEYIYGEYFIGRKLTEMDRIRTLSSIASQFPLTLYTLNHNLNLPNITNRGIVNYNDEMPYVFYYSKVNLNITLKSIKSGIPLRAMDIMSAGGFLMSNFQADFLDFFIPDTDFVYYNDLTDLNEKVRYYLNHEDERRIIAENGRKKMEQHHNFQNRFEEIFRIAFASKK
jgi:spore maturation protein CgeB